jgi:hypothetical protein
MVIGCLKYGKFKIFSGIREDLLGRHFDLQRNIEGDNQCGDLVVERVFMVDGYGLTRCCLGSVTRNEILWRVGT